MTLYDKLCRHEEKMAVVGLGYVGMPLAVAFARHVPVIGYDLNKEKVAQYRKGLDPTREVGDEAVRTTAVDFTDDPERLKEARFFIVAVPTPINADKTPDLAPVENATRLVGAHMQPGSVVVYESTVYPGVTEDICIPLLEETSGLKSGSDFQVGYSPERINPGDKVHRLETIIKIVAATDAATLDLIARVYELIIEAGVHRVSSIKVAEAAKVVENSQRDINIAFMNELAMVFDRMDIDTREVIEAMNTKWNALRFYPGLVGGHCIGVDPYYFIYEAAKLGYHSQIILSGRKINDGMGDFVAGAILKQLIRADLTVRRSRVVIFGLTFKENCPDIRNTKVVDIIRHLKEYGLEPLVVDPEADPEEAQRAFGLTLTPLEEVREADCLVFAVAHDRFKELTWTEIDGMYKESAQDKKILIDVKSMFSREELKHQGYRTWRL